MAPRLRAALLGLLISLAPFCGARADALDAMFKGFVAKERLPGAVLLVSGPSGRRVVTAGVANRQAGTPVTADTRFYVASVTKTLTAVMVAQQIDEGLYRLDSPVAPLVSDLPGVARVANLDRVSVANLLNHTSGLPDYLNDEFEAAVASAPERVWTAATALPFTFGKPATGPVGRGYEYTNTNFLLLGHIVARADHGSLAQSFERRIFQRAGMPASTVGADPSDPTLAHGYSDPDDDGRLKDVSRASWNAPLGDGAVVATAGDLERFLFAAFRDGGLISARMLALMRTPTPAEPTYGFGLSLHKDDQGHCLYHNGSVEGFNAEIAYYVERGTAIVFLSNGDGVSDDVIADEAIEKAAAIVFGGAPIDWGRATPSPAAPVQAAPTPVPGPAPSPGADARQHACVTFANEEYEGGQEPSPFKGRTKAEAWCACLAIEAPNVKGDFGAFVATRRGKQIERKCDKYANWGEY